MALRGLRRRPGFAGGVALTLGLGIGATTTIFSVVDGIMLRPLPYDDPGRLAAVGTTFPTREWADEAAALQHLAGISMLNFQDFAERTRSFDVLAGIETTNVLLPDQGSGPEFAGAARVSRDFFEALDVTPALGRTFLPTEHRVDGDPVVMLSYGAWQRRFGAEPDVVGRTVEPVGTAVTIVGVLPRDFRPPESFFRAAPDFWMPLQPDHPRYASRGTRSLAIVGRLASDTDIEAAREEARAIAADLAAEYPDGNVYPDGSYFGIGVNGLHEETVGTTGRTLWIFLSAAALLLMLASMNSATLLLARALDRARELDVRIALGARRGRVARLLMTEAGLLSAAGGVIGVALAYAGVEAFLRYAPASLPRVGDVEVDARVLAVAAAVSLGSGVAAGLLPAMRSMRRALSGTTSGRTATAPSSRLRTVLVGGQIAVAVVLLSGAGLLFTSFVRILSVEPGFEPDGLVTMRIALKRPGAMDEAGWVGWDRAVEEVRSVPGVESVAATSNPPFQSPSWAPRLLLPGDPPELRREGISGFVVTPEYFETIGAEVVAGRPFARTDGPEAEPVVIVNRTFVRTQLGGADPLGTAVRQTEGGEEFPMRIVGVVEDVVQTTADEGPRAGVYVPYTQAEWPFVQLVVRSSLPAETLVPELRKAVARFNPVVPAQDVRTMRDRMSASRTDPRFQAFLIGAFAAVALLLAAAGLYGALSHAVGRRRREIGVRLALGAAEGGVLGLVLRDGLRVAVAGLVLGLAGALATSRVLADFLFSIEPHDPLTLAGVALVLLLVSAIACLLPARRATTVDPVEVLRSE
jgi:predicted permease